MNDTLRENAVIAEVNYIKFKDVDKTQGMFTLTQVT